MKRTNKYIVYVLFNFILVALLSACAKSSIYNIDEPYRRKTALIRTSLPSIKLNNSRLKQNRYEKIDIGINTISFDGPVLIEVTKEPLIEVEKETATGVAVGTCIAALPLCPISLLFINMAIGTTTQIEINCHGYISFDAWENERYSIELFEIDKITFELRIVNRNDQTMARKIMDCEIPS